MFILSIVVSISAAVFEFFTKDRLVIIIPYGFIIPVLVALPRLFYAFNSQLKKQVNVTWLKHVELFSCFIVAFNVFGSLWLHKMGIQYDRFLHFGMVFAAAMILFLFLLPYRHNIGDKKIIIVSSILVLAASIFLWEGLQYFIDSVFATKLFYDAKQTIAVDFAEDIIFGFFGLGAWALFINYYFKKFLSVLKV